jgi:hypothetical protein
MAARIIDRLEATTLLKSVDFEIGSWNDIRLIGDQASKESTVSLRSPRDAADMLCLAQHATGWIPSGEWKLLQFDNSNAFTRVENVLLSQLLFGSPRVVDFNAIENRTIVFESSGEQTENIDLQISNVVFALLLFESHAYLVSSGSSKHERLGIQDGVIHLSSSRRTSGGALDAFKADPGRAPQWVIDLIVKDQP